MGNPLRLEVSMGTSSTNRGFLSNSGRRGAYLERSGASYDAFVPGSPSGDGTKAPVVMAT